METPELEYRTAEGLNYSALASFYESQDHALLPTEPKGYFEFGKAFELLLRDIITGSSFFSERFFVFDSDTQMPDKIAKLVNAGMPLKEEYNLNKDGSRSKTSKTLHAWLDACQENPGKMPMSTYEKGQLNLMANNMLKMRVNDEPVGGVLYKSKWQEPLFWDDYGIKKKALFDNLIIDGNYGYSYDIKTTANFSQFIKMLRKKYWIQDIHYTHGVNAKIGVAKPMVFLVASKAEPFLCQAFTINEQGRHDANIIYQKLCNGYQDWQTSGCPQKGWKDQAEISLYL